MAGRKKTFEKVNPHKTEESTKKNYKCITKDISKKRFSGVAHKSTRGLEAGSVSRNSNRKFNVSNTLNKNVCKYYKRI